MRLHIPGSRGEYVTACRFPRLRYGRMGGLVRACTTPAQRDADREEVRAYMQAHPGARIFDVALELHFSDEAARRLMKEAGA